MNIFLSSVTFKSWDYSKSILLILYYNLVFNISIFLKRDDWNLCKME